MPKIPFDDDDGRFEFAEPPELSEATKKAMARQQKLDDANFITERTLAFQNGMATEFARAKRDGEAGDPMFVNDLMKVASEMRTEHLSDIPRGPRGRLISQDAVDLTRANMDGAMERFQTAGLHRLNLERHEKAFANIEAAGVEIAAAAKRDAKGLSGLLSTVDDLLGQYEGVFADDEAKDQRARLRAGTVTAAIDGLIERGATGDARELMTGGAVDADLGPGGARFLLGRIDMSEEDNAAKAAEEAAEARSAGVADLVARVATGKVFPVELEVALAQGTIGAEEHAGFLAALERFKDDRARRIEGKERINDLLARREKPDPADAADRAAVDAVFESLARTFAELPADARTLIENDYVARTGMLPLALRDRLIGGMLSEDPAAQVEAAGRFVAFEDSDPVLIVNLPADTLTRARTITAFAYPGLPPARVVHLANEKMARQEAQEEAEAVQAEDEIKGDAVDSPDLPGESADSFDDADAGPLSDGERGEVELDRETEDELIRQLRGADDLLPQAPREGQTVAQKPDKKTRALFEQLATEFDRARKLGIRRFIPPATRRQFDSLVEALPRGKELEELGMALTPVAGEMQSAREAIEAFARFGGSVEKGNAGEAATAAGEGITALLGAIPLIGSVGRGVKAGGKAASAGIKRAGKARTVKAAPRKTPIKPFARTPGGDEVNRLEAVRRKVKAKGNFAQSADDAFGATRFPPKSAEENVFRGLAAADKALDDALRGGRGVVRDAMHRKDVGPISFYWGTPGDSANQYVKGSGLSHIIAKHGVEVVDDVVETVARGSAEIVRFGTDQRAIITHKGRQAVLGLFRFEKRETWLITGYRTDSKTALKFDLSKFERPIFFAGKGN